MPYFYEYGEDGYDALHEKWVSEGRPSGEFEQLGEFGGRRWTVIPQGDKDHPTFSLLAASGPTDTGYDDVSADWTKPDEWNPRSGYMLDQINAGLQIREGPGGPGDMRIKVKLPPQNPDI